MHLTLKVKTIDHWEVGHINVRKNLLIPTKTFGLKVNKKRQVIRKMLIVGKNYGIKPTKDSIFFTIMLGN